MKMIETLLINSSPSGQMRKYEQTEKALKQTIIEKDFKIEEMTAEFKKKLNNEKRRSEQNAELAKKYKEDSERKISIIMQEVLMIRGSFLSYFSN